MNAWSASGVPKAPTTPYSQIGVQKKPPPSQWSLQCLVSSSPPPLKRRMQPQQDDAPNNTTRCAHVGVEEADTTRQAHVEVDHTRQAHVQAQTAYLLW